MAGGAHPARSRYGDSFGWGFVNSSASFVLALLTAGLFVHALVDVPRRRRWAVLQGVALLAVLLMHVQGFLFLALALPFLLLTTRVPDTSEGWVRPRLPAVLSTLPAVLLFAVWGAGRLLAPSEVEVGAPWKAWGPLLSAANVAMKPVAQNVAEFPVVLANLLRDGSDRWGLRAVVVVALIALGLWFAGWRGPWREQGVERWRMVGLAALAGALFLFLPFDIRGAVYYLNTRYAHLAAPLAIAALPPLALRIARCSSAWRRWRRSSWPFPWSVPSGRSTPRLRPCSASPRRRRPGRGSWASSSTPALG